MVRSFDLRTIEGKFITLGTIFFVKLLSQTLISTTILTKMFNTKINITKMGAVIKKTNNEILNLGTNCVGLIVLNLIPLRELTSFALVGQTSHKI